MMNAKKISEKNRSKFGYIYLMASMEDWALRDDFFYDDTSNSMTIEKISWVLEKNSQREKVFQKEGKHKALLP